MNIAYCSYFSDPQIERKNWIWINLYANLHIAILHHERYSELIAYAIDDVCHIETRDLNDYLDLLSTIGSYNANKLDSETDYKHSYFTSRLAKKDNNYNLCLSFSNKKVYFTPYESNILYVKLNKMINSHKNYFLAPFENVYKIPDSISRAIQSNRE